MPHSLRGAALRRAIPRIPASPGIAPSQPAGNRPSPFLLEATSVHLTDQAKYRYHTDAGKAYVLLAESSSKEIVVPEALGGAPVTEAFCEQIGADAYTADAASCAEKAVFYCAEIGEDTV